MNVQKQRETEARKDRIGISFLFYFAMLIVLTLEQNPDWENGLLWWGSIAFLLAAFLLSYRGTFIMERNYTVWMLAFFLFGALSFFWAVSPLLVSVALKTMFVSMIVLFLVHSVIQDEEDVERVMRVILISVIINVVWLLLTNQSMFEATGGQDEVLDRLGTDSLWNANSIGMMSAIAMLFALYFRKKTKKWIMRWFYIGIVALMILVTLLSGSRKALLMVFIGLCGFLFVTAKGKRLRAILIIGMVVFFLYYLVMEVPFFHSIVGWRVESFLASFTGNGSVDSSTEIREEYVVDAIRAWRERPLIGCGLDCYREINEIKKGMYAHNNYVELLADLGVIGAVIYYSAYVYCFVKLIKSKSKNELRWLLILLLIIFLLMDYGSVSYNSLFNGMLLMLMFSFISIHETKTVQVRFSLS